MNYVKKQLTDVEDSAVKHGFSDIQASRFPTGDLAAEDTGLAYHVLRPGKRQPFAHKHDEAEEIHVILSGSGQLKLDDEIVEVGPMDAIRVAPKVTRQFEAGPDGLEYLVFGPRKKGDGEIIQEFWN